LRNKQRKQKNEKQKKKAIISYPKPNSNNNNKMKLLVVIMQLTFMWLGFAGVKLAVNLATHINTPSTLIHGDKMVHHWNISVMIFLNLLVLYMYMKYFSSSFSHARAHHPHHNQNGTTVAPTATATATAQARSQTHHHAKRWPYSYYILVGLYWALLSAVFQFGYGKYVLDFSLDVVLHEYELHRGRFWSIVLLMQVCVAVVIYGCKIMITF